MLNEAAPLIEEAYRNDSSTVESWEAIKYRTLWEALKGNHREAQATIPSILAKARRNRGYHHLTYNIARAYALGSKSEEAVKWLRVTAREGFPCYPLFERDTFLNPIRNDPAFVQFMAEMKTRWEGYQRQFG